MTITVERLFQIFNALVSISNKPRQIPAMAKFKLAKMHDTLVPFFETYNAKRIALVQKHGEEQFADPETKLKSLGWGVRNGSDQEQALKKEWEEIEKETVEVNLTPLTTTMLGDDPKGIEMVEFIQMGDLIVETE